MVRDATPGPVPPEEIKKKFEEALMYCKDLKSAGRLVSGYDYGISEEGRITLLPTKPPPEVLVPALGLSPDIAEQGRKALGRFQELRHALGTTMDLEANAWNSSPIGTELNYIEQTLRPEVNRMQDYAKGNTQGKAYNIETVMFLARQIAELTDMLLDLVPLTQKRQMKMLNEWAEKFRESNSVRATMQSLSASAEMIVALDELRTSGKGDRKAVEDLMQQVVHSNVIDSIRAAFKEAGRK